ncbi:extracellular solute-binding protein [Microbacterium betulae]|uniref:Extracellular solute-binding protein n=1 Tax=Microbacterium betulae TaxID=2981139 RepID=A0AA97FGC3_9MICO|nr:extracellular solute-binding protein [Microbacterium sp. AB]WOF22378.1 extracellular solute-binding protein [Microbacterium sp. AB]
MRHSVPRLAISAGVLIAGVVIAGCAPSSSGDDEITLTIWSWQASSTPKWDAVFDVYEESHPGVTIEFEGYQPTEYNQILATGLEGSDGPDIAMLRAYGGAQSAIQAEQIVPIDDVVDGLDQFDPTVLRAAQGIEGGATYGVPFAYQTMQMFYNKTLFDDLGLEEPTTWDEFIALQDTLVEEGVTPMALGAREDWVLPMFADIVGSARYGGADFEERVLSGETDFTDPDYVASLQIVQDLQQYFDKDVNAIAVADATLQFTTGQAAQWPGGSFDLPTFQDSAPDTEWGVYEVPPPPGSVLDHAVTPGYADGSFGINASSDQQEEATELLNWMTTAEFGQLVADEVEQFSALPGVEYSDALMREMNEQYTANPAPYLLLVDFRYGDPTGTAVLGPDIQAMFLGQKTPEQLAEDLQSGISTWFTPSS